MGGNTVRFIDIKGLVPKRDRIRRIDIAQRPEGTILGVLTGDDQRTHTVHWLRLSDGAEFLRRSVPVYDRTPNPALSPDLSILAYTEQGETGEHLVLERPLEPQRGRRVIPFPEDPWGLAEAPAPETPARSHCHSLAINCDGGMLRASLEYMELCAWNIRDAFNAEAPVPMTEGVIEEYPPVRVMAHARLASLGGTEVHVIACEGAIMYLRRPDVDCDSLCSDDGGEPRAGAFSPDGALLAVALDNRITLWETANLSRPSLRVAFRTHEEPITAMAFSPDSQTIATASTDGQVLFWGVDGSGPRSALDWRIGALGGVAFSPDGFVCIAGGESGRLVAWDLTDEPSTPWPPAPAPPTSYRGRSRRAPRQAPAFPQEAGPTANWVTVEDFDFPPDVAVVGHEADGTPLYAARGLYRKNLLLGKVRPGLAGANLGYKNKEVVVTPFEVLVGSPLWRAGSHGHMPRHAVACGHDSRGRPFCLVRARIAGGLYPGKIGPGLLVAVVPFGGVELTSPEYEVLIRE